MKEEKHVRISQCMIVKNEEKNIERALSWGKSVMWEQVVVDTGSTDRTVELARQQGAKVAFFPWADDFAAAKNYAIGQAQGDWIAFLDADEYMVPEDAEKLAQILDGQEGKHFDGISTGWQQLDDKGQIFASGTQIRFFRNLPDIRYRRRIHEQLESQAGRELKIGDVAASLSIFHTGYQGEAGKAKGGRNRRLILEELKGNPQDYEMMGYMGDECLGDGEKAEAEQWYRRAVEEMPLQLPEADQRSAVTYSRLLLILAEKEEPSREDVEEIYRKAAAHLPKEADFDYIMGRFYASQGQAGEALASLEEALKKLEDGGCTNRALMLAANLTDAYELLVRCSFEAGSQQKCVSYAVAYLQHNRYSMAVLSRLLLVLAPGEGEPGQEEGRRILEFFGGLYDFTSPKDRMFLVRAAQRAGCGGFGRYAAVRILTPQEQEGIREAGQRKGREETGL